MVFTGAGGFPGHRAQTSFLSVWMSWRLSRVGDTFFRFAVRTRFVMVTRFWVTLCEILHVFLCKFWMLDIGDARLPGLWSGCRLVLARWCIGFSKITGVRWLLLARALGSWIFFAECCWAQTVSLIVRRVLLQKMLSVFF